LESGLNNQETKGKTEEFSLEMQRLYNVLLKWLLLSLVRGIPKAFISFLFGNAKKVTKPDQEWEHYICDSQHQENK
jgi:hypothetical protein